MTPNKENGVTEEDLQKARELEERVSRIESVAQVLATVILRWSNGGK